MLYSILLVLRANLKEFPFKMQLNYTVLHPFVMFLKIMKCMKVDNKTLSNATYTPSYEAQLNGIGVLFTLDSKVTGYELKMWKFGRLFNKNFMSVLQTKIASCLLSHTHYFKVSTTNKEGPLQIVQLQSTSISDKKREAFRIAQRTIALIKAQSSNT